MEPHFQHIKAWKFWLSVVALIVEGCIGILSSFLLIITQTTVMDLLLNFTALGFVSHLDELVFFLSRMGILGRRFKRGELVLLLFSKLLDFVLQLALTFLLHLCICGYQRLGLFTTPPSRLTMPIRDGGKP